MKYNQRLLDFIENERTSRITEEIVIKKNNRGHLVETRAQELIEDHRKKNEEKFTKNRENLKSISLERQIYQEDLAEKMNRSSNSPKRLFTTDKTKRSPAKLSNQDEVDIDLKLQELNRKILRSSQLYTRNLQEKVENIQSNRKRVNSTESVDRYAEKLKSISEKHENAVHRRERLKKEFDEKVSIKELKMVEKSEKVKNLIENENKKIDQQSKGLEEKEMKISGLLVEIKQKNKNKIDVMHERMKLLEAGINENIYRMKRLEGLKKEKILEKHLSIERKKNEHLEHLESVNQKIREKAMNFTIEREKLGVIKAQISKTQSPDEVKKILEKYQNLK